MKNFCIIFTLVILLSSLALGQTKTLAESLGYPADAKVLIINADDYGMCHAENLGTEQVLEAGMVSSATMMMTCPWVLEAVDYVKKNNMKNIGVHLALTSEWKRYRWGPVSRSVGAKSTLVDEKGYLWQESYQVEMNADIEDVKREVHAQLQKAYDLGVELSHFDSHMGSLYGIHAGRVEFLAVALSNSYEYGIPFRLPYLEEFKPFRDMGFAILDNLIFGTSPPKDPKARKQFYIDMIENLEPGVTEFFIHPAVANEELRFVTNSSKHRQGDIDVFVDPEVKAVLKKKNVVIIDFLPLRKWQREQMKWRPGLKAEDVYDKYRAILYESLEKHSNWRKLIEKNSKISPCKPESENK